MKIALIIIALIVALIGLYKRDTWPLWATLGLSFLIAAMAVLQIIVEIQESKESAKAKYIGKLEPESKFLLSAKKGVLPKLELGDGGAVFIFEGAQGKPLIRFFEDNSLTILVEDGKLKVSTIVRNKNGSAIAELNKNEWKVNTNNSFDRNYSKNALEVKDDSGDIVLQVKLIEDRIQFQGKFYDANGNGFALGKDVSGHGGIMEVTGSNHPKLTLKIDPIFVYPSDLHIGELKRRDT